MKRSQSAAGRRCVALVAALCGLAVLPGVANAATAALPMTAANLQAAINTPPSQATPAQRALADQALTQATVTATTAPISALPAAPSSTDTPSTMAAAAVGRCFGATAYRNTLSVLGISLAWVQVGVSGWCAGPGNTAIVSVSGWNFPSYTAATYCTKSDQSYHGGDGSYVGPHTTWAHGLHILQVGEGVNGACAGIRTIEQALRIAYNGYNDGYNDWGF